MREARWNILFLSLFDDILLLASKCWKWPSRRINIVKYLIPFTLINSGPIQYIQWIIKLGTQAKKHWFKHCKPFKSAEVCFQGKIQYSDLTFTSADVEELAVSPVVVLLYALYIRSTVYVNSLWIYFPHSQEIPPFLYPQEHLLFCQHCSQKGWCGREVKHESELLFNRKILPQSSQQQKLLKTWANTKSCVCSRVTGCWWLQYYIQ